MNSENLPLLIFDLDGTLIDSAPDIHFAINQMLRSHGRNEVDLETLISHIGDGLVKLVNDFFPEFPVDSAENAQRVEEFLDIYRDEHLTSHTQLYPGVRDFLQRYSGPKAIVTNKNIDPTMRILHHFEIHSFGWTKIFGGDSLPERKPSGLPLHEVMKAAKRGPEHTLMIGDGRPDMKAAGAVGCKKVAVHYGYSKPEELEVFNPDYTLSKFADLQEILVQNFLMKT